MRKSIVWFLTVAIIVVSLGLAGCGGGKQDAGQTVQPAKQESVADLFAKGKNLPGMSYDFVMTAKDTKMTGMMWISGKKMKSEMTMQNDKMMTIVDGDANVAYTYSPAQGTAFKVPLDNKIKTAETPDRFTKDVDAGTVKVLETTTHDGARCKVLLIEDGKSKAQTKMWVREDYGIPLRVEVIDSSSDKMIMEYKNLKIGPQSADIFQLPAGVKVTDMGEMMKNLPPKQ